MGEMTTGGYSLIDIPRPEQTLIHVHPGAEEINRTYAATLAVQCTVSGFCQAIESLELNPKGNLTLLKQLRSNYESWNRPVESASGIQLAEIMAWLNDNLPQDAIITNGAGNYSGWIHRFFRFKQFHTQLGPTSGSMGYGLPAALAAKCMYPDKTVVCFAGDGCFQMTLQEMATAVQFDLNVVIILVDNGSWGTIRMHQELSYPGRVKGTELVNPEFNALARAYGFHTEPHRHHR